MLFRETPLDRRRQPSVLFAWGLLALGAILLTVSLLFFLAGRAERQSAFRGSTSGPKAGSSATAQTNTSPNAKNPGTGAGTTRSGGSTAQGGAVACAGAGGRTIDPAGVGVTVSGSPSTGNLLPLPTPSLPRASLPPAVPSATPPPLP